MADKIQKTFSADVAVLDGERAVTARITTTAVDRDQECLIAQGCNARNFEKNPVVFFSHDYYTLPVGKVVAIKRDADSITAKVVFAQRPESHPAGEEWLPDTLLALFQQGVIKGFSVGLIPTESRAATDRDVERFGENCRRVVSKWELLELSVAPLPCNQEAVALAVSKGFVTADMAQKVWGVEAKIDKSSMACDECGEMYPEDQLSMVDGDRICKKCMEARKSVEPKHVVATIETAQPEVHEVKHVVAAVETGVIPEPSVRHVHRVLPDQPFITEAKVRRLVVAQLSKMRGKIYV